MQNDRFDVPVAYIVYKRLDVTKQSFETIRELQPQNLYIISDGPKNEKDQKEVNAVRKYIDEHIDWECNVHRNYAKKNMGLRYRMPTGMKWVFETAECAIFVEDDIKPTQNFYYFCRDMLLRYKDEEKVVMISGTNLYPDVECFHGEDICFSYFSHIWGWATWKRAYELYDVNIRRWPEIKRSGQFRKFMTRNTYDFFSIVFDDLQYHWYRTWGYQWWFMLWANQRCGIIPKYNLVNNLGMGDVNGEHPGDSKERIEYISTLDRVEMKLPIKYPERILRNKEYDLMYQKNYYQEKTGVLKKLKYWIRAQYYERMYAIIKALEKDSAYFAKRVQSRYKLSVEEQQYNKGDKYRLITPKEMRKSAWKYIGYKILGR